MAIYIVGDIQGCFQELLLLLESANFSKDDELWAAGDIVARGPNSLETLRFLYQLGNRAKIVLGNHDLHLLATAQGLKKRKASDKLDPIFEADDKDTLLNWLSNQPLLRVLPDGKSVMTHAGISPQWSLQDAIENARFAEEKLASKNHKQWLAIMYGEQPNSWFNVKSDEDKFRYTINALTRMRYCYLDKSLEFSTKSSPTNHQNNIKPWYELADALNETQCYFGHWASLCGECSHPNAIPLDTGCVWGGSLTMLRWEDKKLFSYPK